MLKLRRDLKNSTSMLDSLYLATNEIGLQNKYYYTNATKLTKWCLSENKYVFKLLWFWIGKASIKKNQLPGV